MLVGATMIRVLPRGRAAAPSQLSAEGDGMDVHFPVS